MTPPSRQEPPTGCWLLIAGRCLVRDRLALVWLLSGLLACAALALYLAVVRDLEPLAAPFRVPWYALVPLFYLSEVFAVHIHLRREAHSITLGELPLIFGLFFADPATLVLAQLVGHLLALGLHLRQPPIKLAFNLARFTAEAVVTVALFHALLDPGDPVGPSAWLAVTLAALLPGLAGLGLVVLAIWLAEGSSGRREFLHVLVAGAAAQAANVALVLVVVIVAWQDARALWLLGIPAALMFVAYRAYSIERNRRQSIHFLYDTTRAMQRSKDVEAATAVLLERALEVFHAEAAELLLVPGGDAGRATRTSLRAGGEIERTLAVDLGADELWRRVDAGGEAELLRAPDLDPGLRAHCERRGVSEALVAPLLEDERVIGSVVLINRSSDVIGFTSDDLRLFETLVANASVSLENDRLDQALAELTRLERELSHLAFHDSLTELPNRALFVDRVEHALARRPRADRGVAVLLIDLDDFKTVNDSLGHSAGDELLVSVAERLRHCLRPADTAARLGGDEFAVLLDDVAGPDVALLTAERVRAAFAAPLTLDDREVSVNASVGIALGMPGRHEAHELLRNADLAMYAAKQGGKSGHAVFESEMHETIVDRHELAADLRRAVARDEFEVVYQPTVDLASGRLVGVEGLLRWHHPQRGDLMPAEFIPLAEETGSIVEIGAWVLREACLRASGWHAARPDAEPFTLAINLSARQLQAPHLVDDVRAALADAALDPSLLVLEITESALMVDTDAATARMHELRALGVRLSLDDFGTGYSSLGYLSSFPIDQLKIPKVFIDSINDGEDGLALARTILRLADSLGLRTVAEGIESPAQVARLLELSCELGQGFLYSRPVPGDQLELLLAEWAPGAVVPRAA